MTTPEDLTEIERAGRRCAICHSGRRWRQFEVVRVEGQEPVVMCPACSTRQKAVQKAAPSGQADQKGAVAAASQPKPAAPARRRASGQERRAAGEERKAAGEERRAPGEDRLRKALRELPREPHSVGRIAKAAGLNREKTLSRLHALEAAGEVEKVGKRWSTEPPSGGVEAAFDRLQARTRNLRIIRDREHAA